MLSGQLRRQIDGFVFNFDVELFQFSCQRGCRARRYPFDGMFPGASGDVMLRRGLDEDLFDLRGRIDDEHKPFQIRLVCFSGIALPRHGTGNFFINKCHKAFIRSTVCLPIIQPFELCRVGRLGGFEFQFALLGVIRRIG